MGRGLVNPVHKGTNKRIKFMLPQLMLWITGHLNNEKSVIRDNQKKLLLLLESLPDNKELKWKRYLHNIDGMLSMEKYMSSMAAFWFSG